MDRHYFLSLVCLVFFLSPAAMSPAEAMPYTTSSVQGGEWSDLSRIDNRADFSLDSAIISIHAFVSDQRSFELDSLMAYGLSVDERIIGTHVVFGPLHAVGLPARLADPLGRTLPSGYGRLRSDYRLDTGASGLKPSALFASFSPKLPKQLELAAGFTCEPEDTISGVASFGIAHASDRRVRLDVLATQAQLPPRRADAWFSTPPPLPPREQALLALSISAGLPFLSAAFDLAWSDQHFSGKGWHIGGTTNVRNKVVSADISADYTSSRFTDTEGIARGSALRASIETRLKRPSSIVTLGINAAIYDSPLLNDTIKLKIVFIPSEASGKTNRRLRASSPFNFKAFSSDTLFTEQQSGTWIPTLQFRINHTLGNTIISEKAGLELDPKTFASHYFSCGVEAAIPLGKKNQSEPGLTELNTRIAIKLESSESPVYSCRLGVEWKVKNGGINVNFGTDDSATAEKLFASFKGSKSAFGPWTLSLSWRFEESSPPSVLIR